MADLAVAGYQANQSVARKLADDLLFAAGSMNGADWARFIASATGCAIQTTARVRWANLRSIGRGTSRVCGHIRSVGVRQAITDAYDTLRSAAMHLPARSRAAWERFRQLPRGRQADEIAQMLLTWMVFYAAAGGADLEGGLPDTDLLLGIGHHRSVFTHSVLLGLETEMALRFGLAALDGLIERMPPDRHPVWARIAEFLDRYGERTITGIWLGIGAHLLKDANLLSPSGTKPVVGLPWSMPMDAHQAFLAANGAASAAVGATGRTSHR